MKRTSYYSAISLVLIVLFSCERGPQTLLSKSVERIKRISSVEQVLRTEFYDSLNYFSKIDTSIFYFNYDYHRKVIGAKYHCPGEYLSQIRSKDNYIYDDATFRVNQFGKTGYSGPAELYFPIGTIDAFKRFVPNLLLDNTAQFTRLNDTIIGNKGKHYHIQCLLNNKYIQPGGSIVDLSDMEDHLISSYDFLIHINSGLPIVITNKVTIESEPQTGWEATTLKYNFNPPKPDNLRETTSSPINFLAYNLADYEQDQQKRMVAQLIDKEAPDWEIPDLDNNLRSLDEFKDKLVLIEFWYIGCGHCHESITFLNQVKSEYDSGKVQVIGINFVHRDMEMLTEYVKESDMHFLVLNDTGQTAIKYHVKGAPLILLIKNGTIVYAVEGYSDQIKSEISSKIEKYI
jgi:thiol-disulfide isomerase/thioredoxin